MAKLIMTYAWGSDESRRTETVPVESESVEKFLVDFREAFDEAISRDDLQHQITFLKVRKFWALDFVRKAPKNNGVKFEYYPPIVQTLEDWFEQNVAEVKEKTLGT